MSLAHVLTVADGAADDRAARDVARALAAEGTLVASRQVVDPSEAALEPALRGPLEGGGLTVVLAEPGGSAGELVPRVVARLTGARLVLNERRLALLEASFAQRGQAMPRRLDRLGLLPKGALASAVGARRLGRLVARGEERSRSSSCRWARHTSGAW